MSKTLEAFLSRVSSRIPGSLRNRGWIWADRAIKSVMAFATVMMLAIALGSSEFGRWVFVWSVCAFATPMLALPPASILVKEFATTDSHGATSVLRATYRRRIPLVLACIPVALLVTTLTDFEHEWLCVLGGAILCVQSLDLFDPLFLARGRGSRILAFRWGLLALGFASRLIVARSGGGAQSILLVQLAESILLGFLGWTGLPRLQPPVPEGLSTPEFKGAGPLVLTDLLSVVVTRLDQFLVGVLVGIQALGGYGLATRFAEAWLVVPMILISSWMGDAARKLRSSEPSEWRLWMVERYRQALLVSLLAALSTSAAATIASKLFLGADYSGVSALVLVLNIGGIFAILSTVRGIDLVSSGRTGFSLVALAIGASSSLSLLWWLVPRFGLMGGAAAIALSQAATFVLPCLLFPRLRIHLLYLVGAMKPAQPSAAAKPQARE